MKLLLNIAHANYRSTLIVHTSIILLLYSLPHLPHSGGYPAIILDRPTFYDILLKNLPKHKILYNKRVLAITQSSEGAMAKCSDGR